MAHAVAVAQDLGGLYHAACAPCLWSATDPDPEALARVVAAHMGGHGRPLPRCHPLCYDEHGHTDGCLYDDGRD